MNNSPVNITKKEKEECDVRSIYVDDTGELCHQEESDPAHRKLLLKEKFTPKPKVYALEVDDRLENTIDWNKIYPPKYFPKAFKAFIDEEIGDGGGGAEGREERQNIISIVDGEKSSNSWDNILKELICNSITKTGELTQFCCYFAAWAGGICATDIGGRQFETFIICSKLPLSRKVWCEIDRQMFAYLEGYENSMSVEQIAAVAEYMLKESPKPNLDILRTTQKLEEEVHEQNARSISLGHEFGGRAIELDKKIDSTQQHLLEARLNFARSFLPSSDSRDEPVEQPLVG